MRVPKKDGVKIIVAGLPRTSTTSLKKAFDILGIGPSFHLGDPPAPISRVKQSARALQIADRGVRLEMLKTLYDGFEAVFEPPASACVDDMMQLYPAAKVILTKRDSPQKWVSSYHGLGTDLRSPLYRVLGYWIPGVIPSSDLIVAWTKVYMERFGLARNQIPSPQMYLRHIQWVQDVVPARQLLVFQPTMGWEPLCEFLGIAPPQGIPFPRVNEAAFMRRVKRTAMILGSFVWIAIIFISSWCARTTYNAIQFNK